MKPDPLLVVVWWLWLVPALMVLLLPVQWCLALLSRGRESLLSSGVGGDGFAILGSAAVPFILGILPFVLLSLLYGFLFWRHRERRITLGARFWVPIYGSTFIVVMLGVMALVTLSHEQREYWAPPPSG
jgi:O-antigen/teichoic acid export membrane protein